MFSCCGRLEINHFAVQVDYEIIRHDIDAKFPVLNVFLLEKFALIFSFSIYQRPIDTSHKDLRMMLQHSIAVSGSGVLPIAIVTVTTCGKSYKASTIINYDSRVVIKGFFKSGTTLE